MDETLIEIKKRINECFTYIQGITSMYELIEFEKCVEEGKRNTPFYRKKDYKILDSMTERIDILKKMISMKR